MGLYFEATVNGAMGSTQVRLMSSFFKLRSNWIEHIAVQRATEITARLHHPIALDIQLFGLRSVKPGEVQFIRNIRRALDRHMAVVPK